MGLYGFQKRFVPHIKSARKRHTIRAKRVHPDKPGNPFYGYQGLRTKRAKKVTQGTVTAVADISIQQGPNKKFLPDDFRVFISGQPLDKSECELLAYHDGFDSFAEMMEFWEGRLPFKGDIIYWKEDNGNAKSIATNDHQRRARNGSRRTRKTAQRSAR